MNHQDHVMLLKKAFPTNNGGVWADFGSGEGAFTLALRDLIGEDGMIYSLDADEQALNVQENLFKKRFPSTEIQYILSDFMNDLVLPPLDGFIAANAIHFEKDHVFVFRKLKTYLKPHGKIIIVEYNVDIGNTWVPYPFSFETLHSIARDSQLSEPKILHTIPSQFLKEIYSAKLSNSY